MKKNRLISKDGLEVLALAPPTDVTKTPLSELENEGDLFVACDGTLYHIESDQLEVDYIENMFEEDSSTTIDEVEGLVRKWADGFLKEMRKIVKKHSTFQDVTPVELVHVDDGFYCVFIDRKATKKERDGWMGYLIEQEKRKILHSEKGLIAAVRNAMKAGLRVSLTPAQFKVVQKHNDDIKRIVKKEYGSLLLKVDEG